MGRAAERAKYPGRAVQQMLVAKTPFVILSPQMAPSERFPTANLSSHYASFSPETAACSGGQAATKSSPNLSMRHHTVATTNS